ncbi:MAG: cyclic nucleotide-binding domain-containing protein [Planctomycetes bacterium]|nr:cyclic nucleotide-binding domain-containing protein [Planctomycetota bacterium]
MTDEDVARLLAIEPFSAMDPRNFPERVGLRGILRNDTRIRRYRNGTVVVRQGDYGNSAFLILAGSVRVILEGLDPKLVGRSERRRRSVIGSVARLITNPRSPESRDARRYPQMQRPADDQSPDAERAFVQDVNILRDFPAAFEQTTNDVMTTGELFGELAALGRIPRSATVVADGECELLEIRWQGLRDLRKYDAALRQHTDDRFRRFGLSAALRASPLLAGLSTELLEQVTSAAEFETYGSFDWYGTFQQLRKRDVDPLSAEPVIAEQGHYPNGLVLIRAGFARVSRKLGHGEQTFNYLGKGDVYGLAELVHNAGAAQPVPLASTLRAVGYVDVVRIPTRTFEQVILPNLPAGMRPPAALPVDPSGGGPTPSRPDRPGGHEGHGIDPPMLEFLVEHRFINGTATMMIDMDRCTRCDDCVRACASGHDNNPRFIRHGPTIGHHMIANACMHCADPVCMIGCPTGAIHRSEESGEVVINDLTCIGCGTCAASCPYDNIQMVEIRDRSSNDAIMIDPAQGKAIVKATKCDLCIDHHGGPACERACPHDALKRVDMRDLDSLARWLRR